MIVAFVHPRPRVGKTALVATLGFEMARRGDRVLAIDLSPSHGLTSLLSQNTAHEPRTVGNLLMGAYGSVAEIADPVRELVTQKPGGRPRGFQRERFDLAPASPTLYEVAARYYLEGRPFDALRRAIAGTDYRWVLIDAPSAFDPLFVQALLAADAFVVPVRVGDAGWREGLDSAFHVVHLIEQGHGRRVPCLGVVQTEYHGVALMARDARDELGEYFSGERAAIFRNGLRPGAIEAAAAGKMLWEHEGREYATMDAIGVSIRQLAEEFLARAGGPA